MCRLFFGGIMNTQIVGREIRSRAPKRLNHFTVPQGSCTDQKYIYIVFERKARNGYSHRCKIVKINSETMKIVRISKALKIGHGNDITYKDGILYITHSVGSKTIHRVNAKTLKKKEGIKVKVPSKYKGINAFNGISTYGKKGFILRVMGGRKMVITDEDFKVKRVFKTDTSYQTSQGMTTKGMTIIRAYSHLQSGRNYLVEYNVKGKQLKRKKINLKGEMESVFCIGEKTYVTTYIKKGKKRLAYIAQVL